MQPDWCLYKKWRDQETDGGKSTHVDAQDKEKVTYKPGREAQEKPSPPTP